MVFCNILRTSKPDRGDDDAMKWNGKSTITNSVGKRGYRVNAPSQRNESRQKISLALSEQERTTMRIGAMWRNGIKV